MTCPLCGIGILPGKICINCGYDPNRPGVRPSAKPAIPEPSKSEARPDPLASIRDMLPTAEKKGKGKQKDKAQAPASRTAFSDADDILGQIDKLGSPSAPAPAAPRATLQQATVPVTTQFAFEGRHIGGYAGLVASTVVVRVGSHDDLLPEGMEMQRLGGGPIGMRLRKAIDLAIADLKTEALERGANAVVGARLEVLPAHGPLAIVTLIGTAVILE